MKTFTEFLQKLSIEISKDLPGFSAQKLMAPLGRKPPTEYMKQGITPKKSAVLVLLYPGDQRFQVNTVFILRPDNEGGSHAGQIAFPGGGFDPADNDLAETALRETEEEIGVDRRSVSLLGALTPLYIPVSNYMVHPYVGYVNSVPEFKIHPLEVQGLLNVDVQDLVEEKNKKTIEKYLRVRELTMQVPCYDINGQIIWGATAMMISEFTEIVKRIK